MAKAKVRTATGMEVSVEGTPAEVALMVAQITNGAAVAAPAHVAATNGKAAKVQVKAKSNKAPSLPQRVLSLKGEGFFNKPQKLADVKARLEKDAYMVSQELLSVALMRLVRNQELTRDKREGNWVYGKR